MNHSVGVGLSFGMTTAIITTVGLMIGLYSSTNSQLVVIGGILTIAIADAFSDALGIHISQESENKYTTKEVWKSTAFTFIFKFIFAMTFLVPVLLLQLGTAVLVSIAWGMLLLGTFSFRMARREKKRPWKVISEHVLIALLVIIITYYVGVWISIVFG
jgi:VIT1/CCC1 family predicted Fe2+/Mn2+ transporter